MLILFRLCLFSALLGFSLTSQAGDSGPPKSPADLKKEAGGPISAISLLDMKPGADDPSALTSATQLKCMRKQIEAYQEAITNMGGHDAFKRTRSKDPINFELSFADATDKKAKPMKKTIQTGGELGEEPGTSSTTVQVVVVLSIDSKTGEVHCDFNNAGEISDYLSKELKMKLPTSGSKSTSSSGGTN